MGKRLQTYLFGLLVPCSLFFLGICISLYAYGQSTTGKELSFTKELSRFQIDDTCVQSLEIKLGSSSPQGRIDASSLPPSSWKIQQTDPHTLRFHQTGCAHVADETTQPLSGNVSLTIPPDVSLAIDTPSPTEIHIDRMISYLTIRTGGNLTIGQAQAVDLSAIHHSHVTLGKITGPMTLFGGDDAVINIEDIQAPAFTAYLDQQASLLVDQGRLKGLAIQSKSNKDCHFGGEARFAWLHDLGDGTIRINRITGAMAVQRDGRGTIQIQNPPLPTAFKRK